MFNPLYHVASLFFHENWAHYESNVLLLVPLGVLLTVLTSDRHVLLVVLTSHVLASVVTTATQLGFGIGTSAAVMAVAAAALVRLVGESFEGVSAAALQSAVVGMLAPFLVALYVLVVLLGGGPVGHLAHFLGFLFGGAIEAMYVFDERHRGTRDATLET